MEDERKNIFKCDKWVNKLIERSKVLPSYFVFGGSELKYTQKETEAAGVEWRLVSYASAKVISPGKFNFLSL